MGKCIPYRYSTEPIVGLPQNRLRNVKDHCPGNIITFNTDAGFLFLISFLKCIFEQKPTNHTTEPTECWAFSLPNGVSFHWNSRTIPDVALIGLSLLGKLEIDDASSFNTFCKQSWISVDNSKTRKPNHWTNLWPLQFVHNFIYLFTQIVLCVKSPSNRLFNSTT